MASSFPRSLSSVANATFHHGRSEQLTYFVSNSVARLFCSSSIQQQHENPAREQAQATQESLHDEGKESHESEDNDEDDNDFNKETGEIGGPKGPEPTRYGDWERNGRCSDF
ncbi:hypothetical protein RJT34_22049 [Clitoria ternatea]|uniref:Succinate dehydrogenase assembly factor 4, mitochondrial n=1 Tax=Clitoria ternatea TaxID=43366 RepID=A0AAN9IVR8_CLITE